jgi:hypothetical protein
LTYTNFITALIDKLRRFDNCEDPVIKVSSRSVTFYVNVLGNYVVCIEVHFPQKDEQCRVQLKIEEHVCTCRSVVDSIGSLEAFTLLNALRWSILLFYSWWLEEANLSTIPDNTDLSVLQFCENIQRTSVVAEGIKTKYGLQDYHLRELFALYRSSNSKLSITTTAGASHTNMQHEANLYKEIQLLKYKLLAAVIEFTF